MSEAAPVKFKSIKKKSLRERKKSVESDDDENTQEVL